MPSAGDRVVFEGIKVGGARREGELLSIEGRAVRVRWEDGTESLMFPGPGAMRVVTKTAGGGMKKAGSPARKPKAVVAKKSKAKKKKR